MGFRYEAFAVVVVVEGSSLAHSHFASCDGDDARWEDPPRPCDRSRDLHGRNLLPRGGLRRRGLQDRCLWDRRGFPRQSSAAVSRWPHRRDRGAVFEARIRRLLLRTSRGTRGDPRRRDHHPPRRQSVALAPRRKSLPLAAVRSVDGVDMLHARHRLTRVDGRRPLVESRRRTTQGQRRRRRRIRRCPWRRRLRCRRRGASRSLQHEGPVSPRVGAPSRRPPRRGPGRRPPRYRTLFEEDRRALSHPRQRTRPAVCLFGCRRAVFGCLRHPVVGGRRARRRPEEARSRVEEDDGRGAPRRRPRMARV
mmetsp:Transcript_9879/g.32181  ORF Transcript_9879/g.32181 Transcript_9879/m.32181 type:complete len:307 (+) Transcript_9879:223-1143(+)